MNWRKKLEEKNYFMMKRRLRNTMLFFYGFYDSLIQILLFFSRVWSGSGLSPSGPTALNVIFHQLSWQEGEGKGVLYRPGQGKSGE